MSEEPRWEDVVATVIYRVTMLEEVVSRETPGRSLNQVTGTTNDNECVWLEPIRLQFTLFGNDHIFHCLRRLPQYGARAAGPIPFLGSQRHNSQAIAAAGTSGCFFLYFTATKRSLLLVLTLFCQAKLQCTVSLTERMVLVTCLCTG